MAAARSALALVLLACGALHGSPANSETTVVLACEGGLEARDGIQLSTEYYKITPTTIQGWDGDKKAWDDNICGRKGYSCLFDPGKYSAQGEYVSDRGQHVRHSLSFDRITGKVEESWSSKFNDSMGFRGDCKPAADPALATGPTKF